MLTNVLRTIYVGLANVKILLEVTTASAPKDISQFKVEENAKVRDLNNFKQNLFILCVTSKIVIITANLGFLCLAET